MLADIAGKPMVIRVAEQASLSRATRVVVATDHPSIAQACQAHGVQHIMTKESHPSGTDRLSEAAAAMSLAASRRTLRARPAHRDRRRLQPPPGQGRRGDLRQGQARQHRQAQPLLTGQGHHLGHPSVGHALVGPQVNLGQLR